MRPAHWLPPVLWMGVIMLLSTDTGSAAHTGELLLPLLHWLLPWASPGDLAAIHGLVRKGAHLSEYAILAALWYRAFTRGRRLRRRKPGAEGERGAVSSGRYLDADRTDRARAESGSVVEDALPPRPAPRSRRASDLEARVERVAQSVAEQVDPEYRHENGQPGEGREPPRRRDVDAPVRKHPAPGRRRRLHPEPEKGERRLDHDDARHVERGDDEPRGERVGQDVTQEDPAIATPEGLRRLHELPLAQREDRAAHDAGVHDPARDSDDDDDDGQA